MTVLITNKLNLQSDDMYTLLIIDMQENFLCHSFFSDNLDARDIKNQAIKNIKKHIRRATKDNANIVYLEYDGFGNTIDALITPQYDNNRITKNGRCGALEVYYLVKQCNFSTRLKICGIFADQCVKETVRGLRKFNDFQLEVLPDAIFGSECFRNDCDRQQKTLQLQQTIEKYGVALCQ